MVSKQTTTIHEFACEVEQQLLTISSRFLGIGLGGGYGFPGYGFGGYGGYGGSVYKRSAEAEAEPEAGKVLKDTYLIEHLTLMFESFLVKVVVVLAELVVGDIQDTAVMVVTVVPCTREAPKLKLKQVKF